jgi:hypothetical protein
VLRGRQGPRCDGTQRTKLLAIGEVTMEARALTRLAASLAVISAVQATGAIMRSGDFALPAMLDSLAPACGIATTPNSADRRPPLRCGGLLRAMISICGGTGPVAASGSCCSGTGDVAVSGGSGPQKTARGPVPAERGGTGRCDAHGLSRSPRCADARADLGPAAPLGVELARARHTLQPTCDSAAGTSAAVARRVVVARMVVPDEIHGFSRSK